MNTVFAKSRKDSLRKGIMAGALLLLTLAASEVEAQRRFNNFVPYSSVAFGVGTSSYFGEMAPYSRHVVSIFKPMRWSMTGNYTRHFTPRFAARASFTWARIMGDDHLMNTGNYEGNFYYARNLHFRNDLKEFAAIGIFKLTPDSRSYDRRAQFGTYLFAGVAAVAHNPMARVPDIEGDQWVKLQPLGTEGQGNPEYAKPYSLVQLAIPVGVGVRYKINPRWDISAELGFRFTSTDYLDDASGNYADPNLLKNDLARAMANRSAEPTAARKNRDRTEGLQTFLRNQYNIESGDPFTTIQQTDFATPGTLRGSAARKDSYLLGMIHINYILGSPIKCPPLK
ncbi:hypothetical protein GCM10027275_05470 [Rhabdobacter roseus]|uniref:DUF6089 domain-containing protein n=1 Tax=Rhabdobacter roseus TaxID=1655419 RepID=A0A840TKV7_9BACT|nr:hypothetical protein [Rhabdobacter roseus]MBB5282437.1 hypothetical protein [Rhabdobacter roseus]